MKHNNTAINANGDGANFYGNTERRLVKLLNHHRGIATAIETTLAILTSDERITKQARGHSLLQEALQIDGGRVAKRKPGRPKQEVAVTRDGAWKAQHAARRATTLEALNAFDTDKPMTVKDVSEKIGKKLSIGILVHHGYLKKKRGGLVRTAKEFTA